MKWVRGFDGLICFGFALFFIVATLQNFFLPSVVVTDIVYPNYNNIITESMKGVLPDVCHGHSAGHPSVRPTCICLARLSIDSSFTDGADCIRQHSGLPAEHQQIGRMNPNFVFFYIFIVSCVYQLVILNSLDINLNQFNRDVQVGVYAMFLVAVISVVMCLFNFEHGIQTLFLVNFMPHQIVLLIIAFIMYRNTHFEEIDPRYVYHYKKAIFSGVNNAATMSSMSLLVCIFNSWTTLQMLRFVYTTVILINVVEMAYNCAYLDSSKSNDSKELNSETVKRNAAKFRMRQAIYLLLISLLFSISMVVLLYFPQHTDILHRVVGTIFIGLLWVLHILFDCTKADIESYQHEKQFNQHDRFVATMRYALLCFGLYMVWGP
jgi:hypothetical protein